MIFIELLSRLLTQRDKTILLALVCFSVLVSAVETIGISAIMLFIGLATNGQAAMKNRYFLKLYNFFGFTSVANCIIFIGISLLAFYFIRAALNIIYSYVTSRFSFQRQHYFSRAIFNTFLHFSYKDFVTKNSTTLSQIIFSYSGSLSQILAGLMTIFAEAFTILCIYGMLFYVSWKMTIVLTLVLGIVVGAITKISSKKVTTAGQQSQKVMHQMGKVYSESYWNFKFLKLLGQYNAISNKFSNVVQMLANSNITNVVWQSIPRFILETIGFAVLIGVIIYALFMYQNASFVLPIVSMYALAFYRFMPSINKILIGYNQIIFHKHALAPLYDHLQHSFEILGDEQIEFKNSLEFKNVSFHYNSDKDVLSDVSLKLLKGDRAAFIGPSGSGKSTLADILMGLHMPLAGKIYVDDTQLTFKNVQSWRHKIGYIPQNIFIFDGTVADNVVCGRAYNEKKIIEVLKMAHINDFLHTKKGIHTEMGEGGVMLSGGQKQRVAIARALYSDPEILVLDEATSSLDNAMESKIMDEVYGISKQITLIIIAHRLSTIEKCNKIFRIENGQACQLNSWADVVGARQAEIGV